MAALAEYQCHGKAGWDGEWRDLVGCIRDVPIKKQAPFKLKRSFLSLLSFEAAVCPLSSGLRLNWGSFVG